VTPYVFYYLDTSALVKRYVVEVGSDWVKGLYRAPNRFLVTSIISLAEIGASLARKRRMGEMGETIYDRLLQTIREEFERAHVVMGIDRALMNLAVDLTMRHPLRGYDAVHLASALLIPAQASPLHPILVTFVSADQTLLAATAVEGLAVEDPMAHPRVD